MSVNPPPFPNVDRFNNLYWITSDTGGLTQAQADLLYLKFPNAQGTENLVATNINGALTAVGISSFTNAALPTSLGVIPAAGDSSTTIPTTAWVQSAITAGAGPNLLPLNNTWTGTNAFNNTVTTNNTVTVGNNLTLNNLTQSNLRQIFASYYNLYDINQFAVLQTTGRIYSTAASTIYETYDPNLTGVSTQSFFCYNGASAITAFQISNTAVQNFTMAGVSSADTSTKVPTTAWVQGAITATAGVKNTWNYQIFNNNTNLGGAQTAVATISVPYNINSTFTNSIRLEVSYCIFVNGANAITPSPVPISTVAPTSPNPNTITILDLYWRPSPTLQYGALVTQSTFAGVLTSQTYQHPTQGALTYTPITISTTQSGANNLIAVTINFPNILYTAPNYLGNLVSASASIRIVNSQGATTRTTSISGGSTAGVAFFI